MTQAVHPNPTVAPTPDRDALLAREAEHFNDHYVREAARGIEPLSDFDKIRYAAPGPKTIFPREYFYHLLSPLRGKDTLEIAAGNGIDASLCAHNGANVHAYDLSEASIEMVRRRAEVNGLSDRVRTQVTGDFADAFPGRTFDAILGYAALHHLTDLDALSRQVYGRLKPGGVAVFAEPVVNSRALDRLRKLIPYSIHDMTEDEESMTDARIAAFARPFDRMVRREFQLTSRLWPIFPDNWPLALALHKLDSGLLRLPLLGRFATVVVFGVYKDQGAGFRV
jgi:2-polyprenyl-3-methyl-5-hydroxy-6-metoxy-1,4-benzoquinol methylase